eukprot:1165725-Rhodomonas_salina.1
MAQVGHMVDGYPATRVCYGAPPVRGLPGRTAICLCTPPYRCQYSRGPIPGLSFTPLLARIQGFEASTQYSTDSLYGAIFAQY